MKITSKIINKSIDKQQIEVSLYDKR